MAIALNDPSPEASAEVSRYKKWVIALFFVALFIPGSINVGIRIDVYRGYLLAMAIPTLLQIRNDPTLRINTVDVLVFLAVFWRALALVVNHQAAEIVNAGSSFLELFFGYLLGRAFIRSAADYRYFFKCFLVTLARLPALRAPRVRHPSPGAEPARRARAYPAARGVRRPDPLRLHARAGLLRARDCSSAASARIGFANAFYIWGYRFPRNLAYAGFVGFMTMLALSSTSILTIALQGGLIVYERTLRLVRAKWVILIVALPLLWFLFQMIVGKNFVDFVADDLVINPYVGDGRKEIFYWGMREAIANPIFGIGKNDWVRPFWRTHPTADNFWVASAMRYGFPHVVVPARGLRAADRADLAGDRARRFRGRLPARLRHRARRVDDRARQPRALGRRQRLRNALCRRRLLDLRPVRSGAAAADSRRTQAGAGHPARDAARAGAAAGWAARRDRAGARPAGRVGGDRPAQGRRRVPRLQNRPCGRG